MIACGRASKKALLHEITLEASPSRKQGKLTGSPAQSAQCALSATPALPATPGGSDFASTRDIAQLAMFTQLVGQWTPARSYPYLPQVAPHPQQAERLPPRASTPEQALLQPNPPPPVSSPLRIRADDNAEVLLAELYL